MVACMRSSADRMKDSPHAQPGAVVGGAGMKRLEKQQHVRGMPPGIVADHLVCSPRRSHAQLDWPWPARLVWNRAFLIRLEQHVH